MRQFRQVVQISLLMALVLVVAACAVDTPQAESSSSQQVRYTLVLAGGTVYSGEDNEPFVADIGVLDDRVVAIGNLSAASAEQRLDVNGLAVAPGLIDIHSHAWRDNPVRNGIINWPDAENYIRQGVTTAISGPDGSSGWPIGVMLERLENNPTSINFGTFVGHNTVREQAMGRANRAPGEAELAAMKTMVDDAMREGAFGLSSGLKYIPGAYSETAEVIELARVAGRRGGIYISHMREEGLQLLDSVKETIRIGEEGGLPTQITHHKAMGAPTWGKSVDSLALVDAALARGVDVSIDQYPYAASSTGIDVLFPAWSLAGGREEQLARFRDPQTRARIREAIIFNMINDRGGNDPARVAIADCEWNPSLNGLNFAEVLQQRGQTPSMEGAAELALELVENGGCQGVYHAMSEQDVVRIMRHPVTMIASDGGIVMPGEGMPHPRNNGAFARVLAKYVREDEVLSLHSAIHKMSRMPADRIKLLDRGRIEVGAVADIAVFDPNTVQDHATFKDPHQFASGVRHVLVNGEMVLLDAKMTGRRPGRVLRPDRADNRN
jgi:dihydroorotase/N-acyl-D-amino-acid deacylase